MRKKKYTYERELRYSFYVYLDENFGTPQPQISKGEMEKAFRHYQCFCARNGYAYESPEAYGLRGLFG